MNRRSVPARQQIALAKRRLSQASIPRGAPYGAMAGQAAPAAVPQGADQGVMAGCAPWGPGVPMGCGAAPIPSPFAGIPVHAQSAQLNPGSLLGVFVQPVTAAPTTLEISCGNTFFNACGARSFGAPEGGENLLTSIVSGFDTTDQLCPGSGIDVAFFQTTDCYCPFPFGCFSNLAPLLLTFDPVDTQSVLAPLNMVLVGDRLEFDGCFPYPPGLIPQPTWLPGSQWIPGFPEPMVAPYSGAPHVAPGAGYGGYAGYGGAAVMAPGGYAAPGYANGGMNGAR